MKDCGVGKNKTDGTCDCTGDNMKTDDSGKCICKDGYRYDSKSDKCLEKPKKIIGGYGNHADFCPLLLDTNYNIIDEKPSVITDGKYTCYTTQ